MKAVAATLGVSRSNLHERLNGSAKPRQEQGRVGYHKAQDAAVLQRIQALVAQRPTYGYRRITALLNRELRAEGHVPVNHKRVYRIMQRNNLLLQRSGFDRPERSHDGKVIMLRSNLRWCSDGLEFACWNGEGSCTWQKPGQSIRRKRRIQQRNPGDDFGQFPEGHLAPDPGCVILDCLGRHIADFSDLVSRQPLHQKRKASRFRRR